MRTLNSLKNVVGNFANNLLLNVLRFVSRVIFVKVLSDVYLGVNGLLSNVLGLLALSELGISTAISYSLYKPLADNNKVKIKKLMIFYKKAYLVIAMVVLIVGIVLVPFLPWFIKDTSGLGNLNLYYLIFLGNMVITYLFSYKRTLIEADQKNYKIAPILMASNFLTTVSQIIVLLLTKNYVAYLIAQSVCILLENVMVNYFINKEYPYVKNLNLNDKLEKSETTKIFTNVKALMYHKIGSYVLSATDNIVISKFIGLAMVGIYSNYILVINSINSFITVLINNVTASFGNLIASESSKKAYKVFKEMDLICYFLYGISAICFINVFTPFITFAFGKKFVLGMPIVIFLSLNNYLVGMNLAPITIQTASGLYKNDRFVPIIQSVINLTLSIILIRYIGVLGVVLGTTVSQIIPYVVKPYIAYKHVFNVSLSEYFKNAFKQIITLIITCIITILICSKLVFLPIVVQVIVNLVISFTLSLIILLVIFRKSNEFVNLKNRVLFMAGKIKEKRS